MPGRIQEYGSESGSALSLWLRCFTGSLTPWSHPAIGAGLRVSSVWSPWKPQSCGGRRELCVPETERGEPDRRSPAPEFHWRKPCLIAGPAKPFIWPAAVPACHPCNLLLKIPAGFLAGRTSCQRALVSQGALREPCCHRGWAVSNSAFHPMAPLEASAPPRYHRIIEVGKASKIESSFIYD